MRLAPLLLLWGFPVLQAQPVPLLQDLSVRTVATGLVHGGGMEVDGQGNVWFIQVQGFVGGSGGLLTRVAPSGLVTTNLGAPLPEMGDLRRNPQGNINVWMNTAAGVTDLCEIFPSGGIGSVQPYTGYQGYGIAVEPSGAIYLGTKATSPTPGIHRRDPPLGVLTAVHPGLASGSHTHLAFDSMGRLHASDGDSVQRLAGSGTTSVYVPPPGSRIRSLGPGVLAHLLAVEQAAPGTLTSTARLLALTPEGFAAPLLDLGSAPPGSPPAACPDLAGTGVYVLCQGGLYHVTGAFTLLSAGSPTPGFLQARLDTAGSAPFVLAADAPGISIPIPGWGTFATSLGTGPSWTLLLDGIGVFRAPDPVLAPWTQTVTAPPPMGLTLTLQAYVLDVGAANGILAISAPVSLQL